VGEKKNQGVISEVHQAEVPIEAKLKLAQRNESECEDIVPAGGEVPSKYWEGLR
jgi:hypothetical protein